MVSESSGRARRLAWNPCSSSCKWTGQARWHGANDEGEWLKVPPIIEQLPRTEKMNESPKGTVQDRLPCSSSADVDTNYIGPLEALL
jgi:hypothetical protein